MATTVRFGKSSCSSITVETIDPICSFVDPEGTTPLTLDVPAPTLVPPIPPNECACFEFKKGEATVTTTCSTPKCTVDIQKRDTDCCSGRYTITPTVEVPCIPFSIGTPTVTTTNKSGVASRGTDGSVTFSMGSGTGSDCCTLTTELNVVLPDCVKYFDPAINSGTQITYYDKGAVQNKRFLSITSDAGQCTWYPTVTPISIPPCSLSDASKTKSFKVTPTTTYTAPSAITVNYTLSRSDCNYALTIDDIEVPTCALANVEKSFSFNVNGTAYTGHLKRTNCDYEITMPDVTITFPGGCDTPVAISGTSVYVKAKYKKTTNGTTSDYTTTDAESAEVKITSDGKTCPTTYSLSAGTIDLTGITASADIGSGGHVFQSATDDNLYINGEISGDRWNAGAYGNKTTSAPTRPYGRGTSMGATGFGENSIPVEVAAGLSYIVTDNSSRQVTSWQSTRMGTNSDGDPVKADAASGVASGPLSVMLPTGLQWHTRGVAAIMSEFYYNESGVLSVYSEVDEGGKNHAALLSPAPVVQSSEKTAMGGGLKVITTQTSVDGRNLEPGLMVSKHDTDFKFMFDGRLVLNDSTQSNTLIVSSGSSGATINTFKRGDSGECTIPVLMGYTGNTMWVTTANGLRIDVSALEQYVEDEDYYGAFYEIINWLSSLAMTYVHVGKAGMTLSVEGNASSTATRLSEATS